MPHMHVCNSLCAVLALSFNEDDEYCRGDNPKKIPPIPPIPHVLTSVRDYSQPWLHAVGDLILSVVHVRIMGADCTGPDATAAAAAAAGQCWDAEMASLE